MDGDLQRGTVCQPQFGVGAADVREEHACGLEHGGGEAPHVAAGKTQMLPRGACPASQRNEILVGTNGDGRKLLAGGGDGYVRRQDDRQDDAKSTPLGARAGGTGVCSIKHPCVAKAARMPNSTVLRLDSPRRQQVQ